MVQLIGACLPTKSSTMTSSLATFSSPSLLGLLGHCLDLPSPSISVSLSPDLAMPAIPLPSMPPHHLHTLPLPHLHHLTLRCHSGPPLPLLHALGPSDACFGPPAAPLLPHSISPTIWAPHAPLLSLCFAIAPPLTTLGPPSLPLLRFLGPSETALTSLPHGCHLCPLNSPGNPNNLPSFMPCLPLVPPLPYLYHGHLDAAQVCSLPCVHCLGPSDPLIYLISLTCAVSPPRIPLGCL
jgi:hypothetical protein